jgi:hypothetical protein
MHEAALSIIVRNILLAPDFLQTTRGLIHRAGAAESYARAKRILHGPSPAPPSGSSSWLSEDLTAFLLACFLLAYLAMDEARRPSAQALLQRPFIAAHATAARGPSAACWPPPDPDPAAHGPPGTCARFGGPTPAGRRAPCPNLCRLYSIVLHAQRARRRSRAVEAEWQRRLGQVDTSPVSNPRSSHARLARTGRTGRWSSRVDSRIRIAQCEHCEARRSASHAGP